LLRVWIVRQELGYSKRLIEMSWSGAVKAVSMDPERYREACLVRAREFDVELFLKRMREEIDLGIGGLKL